MRAQASFEYVMIFSIALLFLLPAIYLFYMKSSVATTELNAQRANQIGIQVSDTIDYMYAFASGSRTTVQFTVPSYMTGVGYTPSGTTTYGTELFVTLTSFGRNGTLLFVTKYPFWLGNCSHQKNMSPSFAIPGKKSLLIESCGGYVAVREP